MALRGYRQVRKAVISAVGTSVLVIGVALLVLPGPGFLVIAAGFAILATEYEWARTMLDKSKDRALQAMEQATSNIWGSVFSILFGLGMVATGVALIVEEDLPLSGPWTGGSIVGGGVILLATTAYAIWTPGYGSHPPDEDA